MSNEDVYPVVYKIMRGVFCLSDADISAYDEFIDEIDEIEFEIERLIECQEEEAGADVIKINVDLIKSLLFKDKVLNRLSQFINIMYRHHNLVSTAGLSYCQNWCLAS